MMFIKITFNMKNYNLNTNCKYYYCLTKKITQYNY